MALKSQIGLRALDAIIRGNFIASCLPSHTSSKLQSLDMGSFCPFKYHIRSSIQKAKNGVEDPVLGSFDTLQMMEESFYKSMTIKTIYQPFQTLLLFLMILQSYLECLVQGIL